MDKMFAFWREAEGKSFRFVESSETSNLKTIVQPQPENVEAQKASTGIFDFWRRLVDKNQNNPSKPIPPLKETPNSKKEIEKPAQRKMSSAPKPQQQSTNTAPTKPQRNWKNDTKNIWMKPLAQLPVANDLPRLIHVITIEDEKG